MSYYGYDWRLYIFKLGTTSTYLVPVESGGEEQAWKDLANRLSRSEDRVRKECKLITSITGDSKIFKL